MTIRELFEKIRVLPDWEEDVKICTEDKAYDITSVGVGERSGDVYFELGDCVWDKIEEGVDKV